MRIALILLAGTLCGVLAHAVPVSFLVVGNTVNFQLQGSELQYLSQTVQTDLTSGSPIPGTATVAYGTLAQPWSVTGSFDMTATLNGSTRDYTLLSLTVAGLFDTIGVAFPGSLPNLIGTASDDTSGGYQLTVGEAGYTDVCDPNLATPGCQYGAIQLAFGSTSAVDPTMSVDQIVPYLDEGLVYVQYVSSTQLDAATGTTLEYEAADVVANAPEPGPAGPAAAGILAILALAFRRVRACRG